MALKSLISAAALATHCGIAHAGGPTLELLTISPAKNQIAVERTAAIELLFDRPVNPASFTASPFRFHVFGERSGVIAGNFTFLDGNTRARFAPAEPFTHGERVWVTMSRGLAGTDGAPFRTSGYSWQFWVDAAPATMAFDQVQVLTTTTPGVSPRPYGGQACDFNDDGAVDICIVNEDTSDLRLFLNNPLTPGAFTTFIQPTSATGSTPSPNEAADFNGDGLDDIVTANTATNTVSVLLGNGNGTFQPRADYVCGNGPHGVAVADFDGDGDIDIAAANTSSSNVGVLLNNGNGTFAPVTTFEGNGNGEWGLTAADMNNDGIADLIVGARFSGRITVHFGNGNGTFTPGPSLNTGLSYWMLVAADINADGNLDITCAASSSGGAVHLGDGLGGLAAPQVFAQDGMIATDVADLDGDGDLDWVLSNFGQGRWFMLENNDGVLTQRDIFPATSNPACALILDFNLDGALDIALIDEISDEVLLMQNTRAPVSCQGDADGNNSVTFADITSVLANLGAIYTPNSGPGDADDSGAVTFADITSVLANLGVICQ